MEALTWSVGAMLLFVTILVVVVVVGGCGVVIVALSATVRDLPESLVPLGVS